MKPVLRHSLVFLAPLLAYILLQPQAIAVTSNIQTIIDQITANEHLIRNIEVDGFTFKTQLLPPGSSHWQDTNAYTEEGDAWYNGLPNSKGRLHIVKLVMPWRNAPAKWVEFREDVGYDGQFGRVVQYRGGPMGGTGQFKIGALLSGHPDQMNDPYQAYADGRAFSLNYYHSFLDFTAGYKQEPLSSQLREIIREGLQIKTASETLYGQSVIRLWIGDPASDHYEAWWLDVTHGYALRRAENFSRYSVGVTTDNLMEIPQITAAAPGIWFPTEGVRSRPYIAKHGWQQRLIYNAAKVIANNPKFDPAIFTVPFPPGYHITDRVRGGGFTTVSTAQTAGEIDKDVSLLRQQQAESTVSTSKSPSPARFAGGAIGTATSVPARTLYIVATATLAVVVAIIAWLTIKRRGRTLLVLISLSLLTWSESVLAGDHITRPNCGVDVAYCGLKWFGKNVSLWQTGQEMHAGFDFDRYCSLLDIKDVWMQNGIETKGYTAGSISEIIQVIPSGGLAVIRLPKLIDGSDIGHFVVLIPDDDGINVVDVPGPLTHMSIHQAATDAQLSNCANDFVVASPNKSPAAEGPVFYASSTTVEMGRIPIGTNDFAGQFDYENHGNQELKILGAHKSCSCMQYPTGDFEVGPGKHGIITLQFTRSKTTGGRNERQLLMQTNDPTHRKVLVTFRFDLAESPKPLEADVLPRAIDYGSGTSKEIMDQTFTIEVDVPTLADDKNRPLVQATATAPDLEIGPVVWADDHPMAMSDGAADADPASTSHPAMEQKVMKFDIHWRKVPQGLFSAAIHVQILKPNKMEMIIPIRGECISN